MAQAIPYVLVGAGALAGAEAEDQFGKDSSAAHSRAAKISAAEGNRKAHEIRRQGDIMQSDAAAAMAAGGGVTDDVGAIKTMGDIEQHTDYESLNALFEGYSQAREHRTRGKDAKKLGRKRAVASLIQGGSTMYGMK